MKLRCKFNCKRLNGLKGVGEGDRGRRPDRRTVFKNGTDLRSIKMKNGDRSREMIEMAKDKTQDYINYIFLRPLNSHYKFRTQYHLARAN